MKLLVLASFFVLATTAQEVDVDELKGKGLKIEKIKEPIEIDEGVLVLTNGNFDDAIKENEFILVEFYAPWCGHCKKLAPEYSQAAKKLAEDNTSVKLAKVDATVQKELGERFGVKGYPTLKLFKGGQPQDYTGARDAEGIVAWLERKTGPPALEIFDAETFKHFHEKYDVVIIGCFKDLASDKAQEFVQTAAKIEDLKFLITSNEDVMKHVDGQDGSIILYKNFDEPRSVFTGDLDVEKWIKETSVPMVWLFNQKNAPKIFALPAKTHMIYFMGDHSKKEQEDQIEAMTEVAKENIGKIVYVYLEFGDESIAQIKSFFGVKEDMLPMTAIYEVNNNAKYLGEPNTVATKESVSEFTRKYLNNELEKAVKSEEIPEDWDKQPVKVLVGKNFDEVTKDKSKDVFVKFYAPWCGHCKQLAPTWEKLGEAFAQDSSVMIAKIDLTANDISEIKVQSFPTLKLFKRDTNEVVAYSGGRDLDSLVHFVKTGNLKALEEEPKVMVERDEL